MQTSGVESFGCPGDRTCLAYLELTRQLTSVLTNVSQFVSGGFLKFLPQNYVAAVLWVNFGDCSLGNISPPDIVAVRLWRTKQEEDGGVFGFRAELSFRLRSEWNIADWRLDGTIMCPHTSQKTLKIHRCSCGIYILKCLLINLDFTDYFSNKKTKKILKWKCFWCQ